MTYINKEEFFQYLIDKDIINFHWSNPNDTIISKFDEIKLDKLSYDYCYYNVKFTTIGNVREKAGAIEMSILNEYLSEIKN